MPRGAKCVVLMRVRGFLGYGKGFGGRRYTAIRQEGKRGRVKDCKLHAVACIDGRDD